MTDAKLKMQNFRQSSVEGLTEDQIEYLTDKWGLPDDEGTKNGIDVYDIIQMEKMYTEYEDEYEMNVDREQSLKSICKLAVKMDKALDNNDIDAYRKLSMAYDQLRKAAKFTDSQKKEQKRRDIDSVGELVKFVEMNGGIIPDIDYDPIDEPQDKIDFMIKDMKKYIDNLVKNELGLSNLIESYIKKAEKNKAQSVEDIMVQGFADQDDDDLSAYVDADSFTDVMMRQIQQEAMELSNGDYR